MKSSLNKYRIIFICENDLSQPVGGTYHVKELLEALNKRFSDITLIIPCYSKNLNQMILPKINDIKIIKTGNLPIIKWLLFYIVSSIYIILLKFKIRKRAIIYSREMPLNIFLPIISKIFNIPYFIEVNGFLLKEIISSKSKFRLLKHLLTYLLEKINFKLSTGIVTVSEQLKKLIQSTFGIESYKITTVYNGVKIINPEPDNGYINFSNIFRLHNPIIIGFLGSCYPYHDIDLLIEAAPDIIKLNPRTRFVIAGDGEMLPEWKSAVKLKDLDSFFYFPGQIKKQESFKFLNSFSICYNLYYRHVAPGMKILEYLSTGKPVLYIDNPENRKLFKNFNNILWVKEHNKDSLLAAIKEVLKNPTKYHDSEAPDKIMKEFSWENSAQNILKVIEKRLFPLYT